MKDPRHKAARFVRPVLFVGCLLAALLLMLATAERPTPTRVAIPYEPSRAIQARLPAEQPHLPSAGPARLAKGSPFRFRVTDRPSGAPIDGAEIRIAVPTDVSKRLGVFPSGGVVAKGATNLDGVADVAVDGDPEALECTVWAEHHATTYLSLNTKSRSVDIALDPGLQIQGLARDKQGRAVAGVELVARRVSIPRLAIAVVEEDSRHGFWQSAVTDPQGSFVVKDLRPGAYEILCSSGGWTTKPQDIRGSAPSAVAAGSRGVELSLFRIALFRLRLIDKTTQRPSASPIPLIGIIEDATVFGSSPLQSDEFLQGKQFVKTMVPGEQQGVYVGLVYLKSALREGATCKLLIQPFGYERVFTSVTLLDPVRARIDGHVDEIALRPANKSSDRGHLLVRIQVAKSSADYTQAPSPIAAISGDDRTSTLVGTPKGGNQWLFGPIPAGSFKFQIAYAYSISEPQPVRIEVGRTTRATCALPSPTGIVIHMLDAETGTRIYDAKSVDAVSLDLPQPRGWPLDARCTSAVLSADASKVLETVAPLDAGQYEITCNKPGYIVGSTKVRVEAGRVAVAEVHLAKAGR